MTVGSEIHEVLREEKKLVYLKNLDKHTVKYNCFHSVVCKGKIFPFK